MFFGAIYVNLPKHGELGNETIPGTDIFYSVQYFGSCIFWLKKIEIVARKSQNLKGFAIKLALECIVPNIMGVC